MTSHSLGILFVLVSFALTVACGGSPHDRAEAVMETAVDRLTVLHGRAEQIVSSAEERIPRAGCQPIIPPLPSTLMINPRPSRDLWPQLRDIRRAYSRAGNDCLFSLRGVQRVLEDARRIRDRLAPESLVDHVTSLRGRLATVPEDGLGRVLDAAATDADAWVALHTVNLSGGSRRVLNPDELEFRFADFEEQIASGLSDIAGHLALAEEKRIEWYGVAGQPLPER